jgi:preprotein translocase subunit SecG
MSTLVLVVHIVACFFLILFVLLQAGKGAELGATLGNIGQTYFGSQTGNILTKITTVIAFVFMLTSIGLTVIQHKETTSSIMETKLKPAAAVPADAGKAQQPVQAPVAPEKK